ncbi:LemA family protein [Thorsellia kenyensis]|uniref:LemA family protein n=1 Tax=Thorsellia kenyensis TaxID=1549888 RepID=A0ABV6CAN3_9GAMM
MFFTLCFIGGVIATIFIVISINNGIIARHNSVKQAWADVVAQERQKMKILPEIERLAQEHKAFEGQVLEAVTAMRTAHKNLDSAVETLDVNKFKEAYDASQQLSKSIAVTVENYPELKTVDLFRDVVKEIAEQEENVGAAIRIYNSNVNQFNTGIEIFPNNFVNDKLAKKKQVDLFRNEEASASLDFTPNI